MRIGFDGKRALNNATGLGNYARILLRSLIQHYPEHEYLLFTPKAQEKFLEELQGAAQIMFPEKKWGRAFHSLWRSFLLTGQLRRSGVELYHGLSNELPFNLHRSGIRSVVTIHDLIFLKHHEQYPFADRQIYELKTRYVARHADRIIAVSHETKNDLIRFYQTAEEKITVIHPAVEPAFYQAATNEVKVALQKKYGLPRKFILNVSSFFPRKNQAALVRAFALLSDKVEEDLLLVGTGGTERARIQQMIREEKLEQRIHLLSGVSNEELPALYQLATVFVYPSLYEGFGMPVLEALCSRTPVITTGGGAMQEAGGKDSMYIQSSRPEELSEALLHILQNAELRKQMSESGYAHATTLKPEAMADKTMEVYKKLV